MRIILTVVSKLEDNHLQCRRY